MQQSFIGVDVGTASARAGLFDAEGTLLATARRPIALWHEPGDVVEQSSDDIWQACAGAIREVLKQSGLPPQSVGGIGFDATCSLVVLDAADRPLSVST
jgi:D-ribulokinase